MQVNLQYAEEHFAELASRASSGEEVEIAQPGKPSLRLVASQSSAVPTSRVIRPRSELFGSGKGMFILSDDWDSDEVNAEIAAEFENSHIFPDEVE